METERRLVEMTLPVGCPGKFEDVKRCWDCPACMLEGGSIGNWCALMGEAAGFNAKLLPKEKSS